MLKSEFVHKPPVDTNKYPCLMEAKDYPGLIVLFHGPKMGVCVSIGPSSEDHRYVGEYSESWIDEQFWRKFTGSITINQE